MWKKLQGSKTNLGIVAAALLSLAVTWGLIDMDSQAFNTIATIVGAFTGYAIRSAYKKGK